MLLDEPLLDEPSAVEFSLRGIAKTELFDTRVKGGDEVIFCDTNSSRANDLRPLYSAYFLLKLSA